MKARQTTQKLTFNIKSSGDEESEMEINEKNVKDVMQANAMNQKHQDDLANLIHIMILKNVF